MRIVSATLNRIINRVSYWLLFVDGAPASGQQLFRIKLPQTMTLVQEETSGDAAVAATASSVFSIKVNSVTVGTITFGAGQTTATASITSAEVPAQAVFEVLAPSPADSTLADVSLSIAVTR